MTSEHADSPGVYLAVFAALLVLTGVTVGASYVDLGPFSILVALAIAATKALLVLLFFMHLRRSDGLIWLAAIAGFFWLGILIVLVMGDVATRGWLPAPGK